MHGQACDSASSMLGEYSGVTKRLNDDNEKDLPVCCLGHCVILSVKSIGNACRRMRDCMGTCLEMAKLTKFSPKRETMLEKLKLKLKTR